MIWLKDVATGRDNNFNLIRALAATAVLVSHAWPITQGDGVVQPLDRLTGYALGTISVFAFFVISGFLIAQSFERSSSIGRFVWARVLRLWPALIVSILAVAFVLGPLVTTLPLSTYLTHSETYSFVLRNLTLAHVQYTLPGVFETLPYPTVEGSIWTLIHEVLCYVGVFVLGVLGLLRRKTAMVAVFAGFLVLYFLVQAGTLSLHPKITSLIKLALPFGVGTAFYVWRDHLPLTIWGVALTALAAWATKGTAVYPLTFCLALGYGVFWAAYVPGGILRAFNRLGDYSYGIYIYAFPMQGLAVWLWGPQDPLTNIALSLPMTLIPSILSWHLIEKPALALRRPRTKRRT